MTRLTGARRRDDARGLTLFASLIAGETPALQSFLQAPAAFEYLLTERIRDRGSLSSLRAMRNGAGVSYYCSHMFCKKCGRENDDDAAFCQKCGNSFRLQSEMQPVTNELSGANSGEHIFSITPTTKFVMAGYAAALLAAFLVILIAGILFPVVSFLLVVPATLLLLLIPAYFHIKQKLIRYTLTGTNIEIDRGLISRTTQNVPLRRVQDVTVTTSLLQRLLGYGDITMDNASDDGGKIVLDNIDSPSRYAELILEQMRHLDT